MFCAFWLTNVLRATAACHFRGSQLQKWLPPWGVLYILTYKCASRHSGLPFSRIATSKMAPSLRCFVHFDLKMCSAPAALARLLFGHQEARILEKTQRLATSLTFRERGRAFYWLYTRVDLLSADLTSLLCLTPLLCFSTLTLHIVGS